ncbi:MAG: DUF2585 family protein [Gemmatimonadetes bacterium]|nr:DUF2585 family protein [Gemmatimonadota bacterium]
MTLPFFLARYKWVLVSCAAVCAAVATVEFSMGRSWLGPDGVFGLWEGDIWSSEQSQRFADPYSFSHVIHGFLFYGILWLAARKLPVRYRLIAAVVLEGAWEVLENSPIIINRYRAVTISLGYVGDSILNSLSDVFMMSLGFLLARRLKLWVSVAGIIATELVLLWLVRDNLTLNIIMLVYPIEAIKNWQSVGHLLPPTP